MRRAARPCRAASEVPNALRRPLNVLYCRLFIRSASRFSPGLLNANADAAQPELLLGSAASVPLDGATRVAVARTSLRSASGRPVTWVRTCTSPPPGGSRFVSRSSFGTSTESGAGLGPGSGSASGSAARKGLLPSSSSAAAAAAAWAAPGQTFAPSVPPSSSGSSSAARNGLVLPSSPGLPSGPAPAASSASAARNGLDGSSGTPAIPLRPCAACACPVLVKAEDLHLWAVL